MTEASMTLAKAGVPPLARESSPRPASWTQIEPSRSALDRQSRERVEGGALTGDDGVPGFRLREAYADQDVENERGEDKENLRGEKKLNDESAIERSHRHGPPSGWRRMKGRTSKWLAR